MNNICKVYKRRWIMMLIFCSASALNASHWLQYAIITNIVMKHYGVSAIYVNWSAIVFSAVYIPLAFPATWLIEKKGLRLPMVISLSMMTGACWLKMLSLDENTFIIAFISQIIIATSQTFLLSVPSRIAGLWFPSNQVSTVCAIGVFGNQIGVAMGFLVPPMVIRNSQSPSEIRGDLMKLHLGMAVPTTLLLLVALFVFENAPQMPPTLAQHSAREQNHVSYKTSLNALLTNKDYIILLFVYGLNVGVFMAISTLLNQMFLLHYPDGERDAGIIGMVFIFGGMFGTIALGYFLDKTHLFKITTLASYTMASIGILGFTLSLYNEIPYLIYISSAFMGIFMTGYIAVAYEFGVELTFPMPESTSSGLMASFGEAIGLILAFGAGILVESYDDLITNFFLFSVHLIGFVLAIFLKDNNLYRQAASKQNKEILD